MCLAHKEFGNYFNFPSRLSPEKALLEVSQTGLFCSKEAPTAHWIDLMDASFEGLNSCGGFWNVLGCRRDMEGGKTESHVCGSVILFTKQCI